MLLCTLYVVCKVQDYWDCSDCWVTVIKKLVVRFVWETELSVTHRSKLIQLLLLVLNKQNPPTYYELLIMQMSMRKMFACEANEKIEYSWTETLKISFFLKKSFFLYNWAVILFCILYDSFYKLTLNCEARVTILSLTFVFPCQSICAVQKDEPCCFCIEPSWFSCMN